MVPPSSAGATSPWPSSCRYSSTGGQLWISLIYEALSIYICINVNTCMHAHTHTCSLKNIRHTINLFAFASCLLWLINVSRLGSGRVLRGAGSCMHEYKHNSSKREKNRLQESYREPSGSGRNHRRKNVVKGLSLRYRYSISSILSLVLISFHCVSVYCRQQLD